uniref:jerky protein homolog-like n=1 Tax=Styela clava TaxID=7725 RepID=UPI0019394BFF|nr:jerky protein homolog-like [Styela clava]
MPRKRKRKTSIGQIDSLVMKRAAEQVIHEGKKLRTTARENAIPKTTLSRYVKKLKLMSESSVSDSAPSDSLEYFRPNYTVRRIFSDEEEGELSSYLLQASRHYYGLRKDEVRELAYEMAVKNGTNIPRSWVENSRAGRDWLYGFMQRHPKLSLRKPEATSLSRATSFNRKNVGEFFDNLDSVMKRNKFEPNSIYNMDETGLTTVQVPSKIIAETGIKQVGKITSAERGLLVTMIGAVNALGNSIPPCFIFLRVNFREHMLRGAPLGAAGFANKSGWINSEIFLSWMKHFVKHANCTPSTPALLLMDNHKSHITIDSLNYAKENGLVLLTFPPHCSHKLQPLDRSPRTKRR